MKGHQYVNHRVNEIRQLANKNDWRFCPGQENPADLATRGLLGEELLNNSVVGRSGIPCMLERSVA